MGRIFVFLLALGAAFPAFAQVSAFDYAVSDDAVSITDYFDRNPHAILPGTVDGFRVTSIATGAFANKNLVSVVIPDSVREIGAAAFSINSLLTIVLGRNVNISTSAFETPFIEFYQRNRKAGGVYTFYDGLWHYFGALGSGMVPVVRDGGVTIVNYAGEGRGPSVPREINSFPVRAVGPGAFAGRGLRSVRIPDTVSRIGEDAFRDNNISRLELPDSVLSIGPRAFARNGIVRLSLPSRITVIEDEVFFDNMIARVEIPPSVISIGNAAFSVNRLGGVSLGGDKLTAILDEAFSVNHISRLELPPSLVTIGNRAFFNNRLERVQIPPKVTALGDGAFAANMLTEAALPPGLRTIGDGAFYQNRLAGISLPEGLAEIGARAFGRNRLYFLRIPAGVGSIGPWAFAENALSSVEFPRDPPAGHRAIAEGAFAHNQLDGVTLPPWAEEVGDRAFYGNSITDLAIPPSVLRIRPGAFGGNPGLRRITVEAGGEPLLEEASFDGGSAVMGRPGPGTYVLGEDGWTRLPSPPPGEEGAAE